MTRDRAIFDNGPPDGHDRGRQVQSIGEVLEELLRQYQVRFPSINIVVVETPVTTV